MWQEVDS